MPDFWLDSDVLIDAKDGLLAFDIAPRFWASLDHHVNAGRVASLTNVYEELTTEFHDDELASWARERRDTHFVAPDEAAYSAMTRVADYVVATYAKAFADAFLDGADPWLVAYGVAYGGQIVTGETSINQPNPDRGTGLINAKVKIPNICRVFEVEYIGLPAMLRALGVNDL